MKMMRGSSLTLKLPNEVYEHIRRAAKGMKQPLDKALIRIVQAATPSLKKVPAEYRPELEAMEDLDDRDLRLDGSGIVAICLHPGFVATAIGERGGLTELGWRLMKPFMRSPEKGAETSLFLATVHDPAPFHGGYVIGKSLARPDPAALDRDTARRLWEESARLVGL